MTLVAALTGVLLLSAAPASAHVELISSTPSSGARLGVAPKTVSLEFSEDIDPRFVTVVLTVGKGVVKQVDVAAGGSPAVVIASVPPTEPASAATRWRIDYRVTSVDGHPIQGDFTFTVEGALPSSASASGSAVDTPAEEPEPAAGSDDGSSPSTARWIWVAAPLLLLLALPALLVLVRRSGRDGHPVPARDIQE